jgi:hypothetical protein
MVKKRKPAAGGYCEQHVALVPLHFDFVPFGTGDCGSDVKVKAGRPVLVQYAGKTEQKQLYEALLELPKLDPGIRRAVMKALGRSLRAQKVDVEYARTATLKVMVDEAVVRMRVNGEKPPKGDIRTAAVEEVAERAGIEAETLKKRLQRLRTRE